jgi:DnaK suppressor protein
VLLNFHPGNEINAWGIFIFYIPRAYLVSWMKRIQIWVVHVETPPWRFMMSLTEVDIEKFKKRLLQLKGQLTLSLKGSTAEVKTPDEATGYSQHQADQGTDDFDRTISLEVTNKEYGILRQIERSLQKMDEKTYGICDITGDEIPMARLEAVPYATMTVKAQEKYEKGLL